MKKQGLFIIGIFIGAALGYGVHWGMAHEPTPTTAYPLSPASQCLWFNRFCEPQEDGGLCFNCAVM